MIENRNEVSPSIFMQSFYLGCENAQGVSVETVMLVHKGFRAFFFVGLQNMRSFGPPDKR